MSRRNSLALFLLFCPGIALAAGPRPCLTADEAARMTNKDICVSAHVYDVVELPDGTRYLDVCPPETPDDKCRFTLVSLWEDHGDVGELTRYRDMDVHVRGIVQSMHGRAGVLVSHARQFYGGPPKFRPNKRLVKGFAGDQSKTAIRDPNLRSQGGGRAFMNSNDREILPKK